MSILSGLSSADRFDWKGVSLFQDELVLKVGTDALLLATWVPTFVRDPKVILDVGTGSGILALLMAQAYPSSAIIAIDPDENAVHLAHLNASGSINKDRIHVEQKDVLEYAGSTDQPMDLIVCNPPFYVNHMLPVSGVMQSAKHATSSPRTWMSALALLLNDKGSICIVEPTLMAFEWIREANLLQLYCSKRLDFFSFPGDKQSKRSLLCFRHELVKPDHTRMTMYTTDKIYTAEYATWLGV